MSHPDHPKPHQHEDVEASKARQPHAVHEEHQKGPHSPTEISPKLASDIAYWSHEFGISGEKLHELIRVHGTHVDKVRAAAHSHKTA